MRQILSHWEQVIGKEIERVIFRTPSGAITFEFNDYSQVTVEPVTTAPYSLDLYPEDVDFANPVSLKRSTLVGRTIKAVVVPYSSTNFMEESNLTLVLEDRTRVLIAADDWFSPIRIT